MIGIVNANSLFIPLKDKSVHCIVTSPPYWGLRDYGTAVWEGGDIKCGHSPGRKDHTSGSTLLGGKINTGHNLEPLKGNMCQKCGARRVDNQIGQETVPDCLGWATGEPCGECYVCHMVQVFRECRRVLRDDGTLWLNLGDSHNGSGVPGSQYDNKAKASFKGEFKKFENPNKNYRGLKPKDLIGIPWRVAFALQADGWYLRMDNVWSKPNPMPESVRDRPTKSHEYIFLFSKSRKYFYDQDAVREPYNQASIERISQPNFENQTGGPKDPLNGGEGSRNRSQRQGLEGLRARVYKNLQPDGQKPNTMHINRANGDGEPDENPGGRNKWSVWTIATRPYPGSHFATYPPELVEPCIKAGTSEKGCCPKCGAPWERVAEHDIFPGKKAAKTFVIDERDENADSKDQGSNRQKDGHKSGYITRATTLGWCPTCKHETEPIPCIVFDPFSGSGTTVMVARALGRDGVGQDLSMKYIQECAMGRLGMDDLKEWLNGKKAEAGTLSDLPMFSGLSS